ncbi:retrovirus-related pol polyprotein from transposon TNT 1-94 [Tanacetum coccineum]
MIQDREILNAFMISVITFPDHKYVGIKSFLMLFGITAVLIDVNAAQSKLVLLVNFNENYSKCLRLLEEVTTARGRIRSIEVGFNKRYPTTRTISGIKAFLLLETILEDVDQDYAHMVAASKVPMLKSGEFELWRMRIEQYIQMIDYALWEVIENGNTAPKITVVEGVEKVMPATTTKDKAQKRLEVKARSTLMMGIPNEHQLKFNSIKDAKLLMEAVEKRFGGNTATKKTQRNPLKQQYENFTAPSSEMLNQTFDRLQKLVSQNKTNLDTMSMGDLYNNLKVYEPKVKGMSSSSSSTQNMAFVSSSNNSNSITNGAVSTAQAINTANGVSAANTQVNASNIDDLNDLEEMDLRWQMAMLTIRARRFLKNTGRKLTINGNESIGFDKSKVECYNCHKKGHFAKEYRASRNQDYKNKESTKRTVPVETSTSTALVSCDGFGGYDLSDEAEEEPNYVLMAYSSSSSDSEVINSFHLTYTGNFMPPTPDLSFTSLDEFVNKLVVENSKAMSYCEEVPKGNPQIDLQDQGVIDSGCSRHMTWNMSYLTDYEEIDGGYVAFGGNPKGGKITRKCTIKTDTKDETSGILKSFITGIENLVDHKVKVIRCDNGTEFKNREMNQFCEMKDRTPTLSILEHWSVCYLLQYHRSLRSKKRNDQKKEDNVNSTNNVNVAGTNEVNVVEADMNNLDTTIQVSPNPTIRIHKDHPLDQVIGDLQSATQIRKMSKNLKEQGIQAGLRLCGKSFYNSRFEDPDVPDRVYKVEQALYGLHQAPRAWYETLSTYLLNNGFQRGKIDKTLYIKRYKGDILMVQVYVDEIIFGSTKKELCNAIEKLMHGKFQMSSMGELTFFLGLQVKQKKDGIFISQDKYVAKILKNTEVKTVSTPMETQKPLLKDDDGEEVDVHMYRLMIGSLMYLTSSRPDIMFTVCAVTRYQVNQSFTSSCSSKTTAWNEFSSTMASAIICLATNQKFNISKYIFESMMKNLDNVGKFLMYPRFIQVFLDKQLERMPTHKRIYIAPSHAKKIFGNTKKVGKGFSGRITPLFLTMVVQDQAEMSEGSANPIDPHHTPTFIHPSTSQPQKKQKPRKPKRKDTQIP